MTHFRTYCIGEYDADELYEKFGEGTEVPEYSKGAVPEEELIEFVEYYTKPDRHGVVSHPRAKKLVAHQLGQRGFSKRILAHVFPMEGLLSLRAAR